MTPQRFFPTWFLIVVMGWLAIASLLETLPEILP